MGWEAQEDGFIAQILVPSGAKEIAVGTPVIVMVEDKVRNTRTCCEGYWYLPLRGGLLVEADAWN